MSIILYIWLLVKQLLLSVIHCNVGNFVDNISLLSKHLLSWLSFPLLMNHAAKGLPQNTVLVFLYMCGCLQKHNSLYFEIYFISDSKARIIMKKSYREIIVNCHYLFFSHSIQTAQEIQDIQRLRVWGDESVGKTFAMLV